MATVFTRDIWCLLFQKYFDWPTVVVMYRVAKSMQRFMTHEQTVCYELIARVKDTEATEQRQRWDALKRTHAKTLKQRTRDPRRGVCSVCTKTINIERLSKHQTRCAMELNVKVRCDMCETCGWFLPRIDSAHNYGCPFAKHDCDLCRRTYYGSSHWCLVGRFAHCSLCKQLIPLVLTYYGKHECPVWCRAPLNRLRDGVVVECSNRVVNGTNRCKRHQPDAKTCNATTKAGVRCTRSVVKNNLYCGQHSKKKK